MRMRIMKSFVQLNFIGSNGAECVSQTTSTTVFESVKSQLPFYFICFMHRHEAVPHCYSPTVAIRLCVRRKHPEQMRNMHLTKIVSSCADCGVGWLRRPVHVRYTCELYPASINSYWVVGNSTRRPAANVNESITLVSL